MWFCGAFPLKSLNSERAYLRSPCSVSHGGHRYGALWEPSDKHRITLEDKRKASWRSWCLCWILSESEVKVKVALSCPTLPPQGLYSPWNSPGQDTGVGSLSLLQGIFPTQGSNSGLPHCRHILYQLSQKEKGVWSLHRQEGQYRCTHRGREQYVNLGQQWRHTAGDKDKHGESWAVGWKCSGEGSFRLSWE